MDAGQLISMRVVLSVDAIKYPLTGIGRYTYELANGLLRSDLEDCVFLHTGRLRSSLPVASEQGSISKSGLGSRFVKTSVVRSAHAFIYSQFQRLALRRTQGYLFHGPNFILPPIAGPKVVTFHDLSIFKWPETHPGQRVRQLKKAMLKAVQSADAIITDTEFTREEIADYFQRPLYSIHAIPLAASSEFVPQNHEMLSEVIESYHLKAGCYVFYTGTIEPRKNLDALFDAYELLPQRLRDRYPLVLSGFRGWCSEGLHERMQSAQRAGWLRYLGFVPQSDLPALMAGARLFVYPSMYEGFGLPVLEAMASGVPVVCSNASTLPEVAGAAALMHAPRDIDALGDCILTGLENEQWRAEAIRAGLLQAGKFSWEKCIQKTLDVYGVVADCC